jgi:hypothetical protein
MKRIFYTSISTFFELQTNKFSPIYIKKRSSCYINLNDIKDDKVVTVNAPTITTDEITYHIPKTVP